MFSADLIDGTSSHGTPALLGFIGGRCAAIWTSVTRDERRQGLLECLSRYFGGQKISTHLIEYAEKDWNVEPYSGGCPCHNATTGSMGDFVDGLRKPYKNIHFAGTETASQWMGYMDGAVDAGRRAASEVLVALRPDEQPQEADVDQYTFESQSKTHHLLVQRNAHARFPSRPEVSPPARATFEFLLRNSNNYSHARSSLESLLS